MPGCQPEVEYKQNISITPAELGPVGIIGYCLQHENS